MIASFKGNVKHILKVPGEQGDEYAYIIIENMRNKTRISYEDTIQWIPFSVDAACTNISYSIDKNI